MLTKIVLVFVLLILFPASLYGDDIYKCVDEFDKAFYTTIPGDPRCKKLDVPEDDPNPLKKTDPNHAGIDSLNTSYSIVDQNLYDAPIKTQVEIHAIVLGPISEDSLKQILKEIYDNANAKRGFKYNNGKPSHIFIYLYSSKDHYKSKAGQWIAMLSKIGNGSQENMDVKTNLITQLTAKPETKFGLSESTRKEIFRAIVKAERRANKEAEDRFPIPFNNPSLSKEEIRNQLMRQAEENNYLMEKYKNNVAKQYRITRKQMTDIVVESFNKNWPQPL